MVIKNLCPNKHGICIYTNANRIWRIPQAPFGNKIERNGKFLEKNLKKIKQKV